VVLENQGLKLYRCGSCGHVFKDLAKEEQERYAGEYFADEHKNWFNNPDYPLYERIYRIIRKVRGNRRLRVLDAGCGTGGFLKYLSKMDPVLDLYGIDLVENSYPGITFLKSDIMSAGFEKKFDAICNLAVIEHLDSPHAFVTKMKALLVPGGLFITVTDNDDGLVYLAARLLKKAGIEAPYDRLYTTHHIQCFSNKSLKLLMKMNGLETVMHHRHNHSVAAVDYPEADPATMAIYKAAIRCIFAASNLCDSGIMQINVSENGKNPSA
jgi:2-polyprenyl-3-methyl-5-hydroxy-6-metoxy-1,4-benzoquinol methylase